MNVCMNNQYNYHYHHYYLYQGYYQALSWSRYCICGQCAPCFSNKNHLNKHQQMKRLHKNNNMIIVITIIFIKVIIKHHSGAAVIFVVIVLNVFQLQDT